MASINGWTIIPPISVPLLVFVLAAGGSGEAVGSTPAGETTTGEPREAMTKDQVSIPLTDGSVAGVVGPALAAVMVGIGLWIGVVLYLSRPTQVWKKNSHRRNNMLEATADSVERGVAELAQKQPSAGAPPQQQQKARRPHRRGQGRPGYRQKGGGTRRPQEIEEELPDGAQSHTRQEMARTRSRNPARSRPQDFADHLRQPLRDATALKVPENSFGAQTRAPGGEDEGKKRGASLRPSSDPDLQDISDSAFQRSPFSLPGRFVRPDREEQAGGDVAYRFERPGPAPSQIRKRVVAPEHDTQHHLQQPLRPSRYPHRRRRPTSPSADDVSHLEDPSGKDPRPFQTPDDETNSHRRPSGLPQPPDSRRPHTTPREKQVYLKPPLELLNPKPNTWRGSGINQLPSRRQSHLWDRNAALDEGQHILDEGDTPSPTATRSSHASYPGTSTPAPPPVSTPLEDRHVDKTSTSTAAAAAALHELGYQEIISAFRFGNGVPVNWIPKNIVTHKSEDKDREDEDSPGVSKDTEEK